MVSNCSELEEDTPDNRKGRSQDQSDTSPLIGSTPLGQHEEDFTVSTTMVSDRTPAPKEQIPPALLSSTMAP